MIRVTRKQYPVGQGCFHSGAVELSDGISHKGGFNYVYDCGSTNRHALKSCIDAYCHETEYIDALFVSHFDDDHVSGLDNLLARAEVDTVYIPYHSTEVIAWELATAQSEGNLTASLIEASLQPETWFGKRGVKRIIRILPNDSPPDTTLMEIPFRDPGDLSPDSDDRIIFKDPASISKCTTNEAAINAEIFEINSGEAILGATEMAGLIDWVLLPHVYPVKHRNIGNFHRKLKREFPGEKITAAFLIQALSDPQMRKKIRCCYDEILNNGSGSMHNRISMSLYSGPYSHDARAHLQTVHYPNGSPRVDEYLRLYGQITFHNAGGWIGTGDATLKVNKVRNAWLRTYQRVSRHVGTLLLPHHGASGSFHRDILDYPNLDICIASAGDPSPYGHPHEFVQRRVTNAGIAFHHLSDKTFAPYVEVVEAR